MKMATDLNHSPSIGVARMGHEGKCGIDRATLIPVNVWWWHCLDFLNEIIYFHYLTVCLFDDKFFLPRGLFCLHSMGWEDRHTPDEMFYQFCAPDKMFLSIFYIRWDFFINSLHLIRCSFLSQYQSPLIALSPIDILSSVSDLFQPTKLERMIIGVVIRN